MTDTTTAPMCDEHLALLVHYGRTQRRCSELLTAQAAEIARLQAEAVRLRAAVVVRDTALAWAHDDRLALEAAVPGLRRRVALTQQVETLAHRVQEMAREVLRWQWRAVRHARTDGATGTAALAHPPAAVASQVLCLAPGASGALVAERMVQTGAGLSAHGGEATDLPADAAAFEASLVAADLVICQTGCVTHDDYWRVQDHCKRTGKPCVLVDQPQVLQRLRPVVALEPVDR